MRIKLSYLVAALVLLVVWLGLASMASFTSDGRALKRESQYRTLYSDIRNRLQYAPTNQPVGFPEIVKDWKLAEGGIGPVQVNPVPDIRKARPNVILLEGREEFSKGHLVLFADGTIVYRNKSGEFLPIRE